MNRETLFEILGHADEELLIRCDNDLDETCQPARMKKKGRHWFGWVGAAACLAFILTAGAGILLSNRSSEPPASQVARHEPGTGSTVTTGTASNAEDSTQISTNASETDRPYVDINSISIAGDEKEVLKLATIQLAGRKAVYESVPCEASEQTRLEEARGSELADQKGWYRLSGHEDAQYLIQKKKNGSYLLWEFESFGDSSYSYKDVLEKIYQIHSADDIAKIVVSPATMDNTDAGKALQKKIGTVTIDDPDELATIYQIIVSLTTYDSTEDREIPGYWNYDTPAGMLYAVQKGRYLTIVARQGNRYIHHLKYDGIGQCFYEYGAIYYHTLKKKEAARLEQLLKIQ